MKCANCLRVAHDPIYVVEIVRGGIGMGVNICGHCWLTVFMAPSLAARLERLAFNGGKVRLPGL